MYTSLLLAYWASEKVPELLLGFWQAAACALITNVPVVSSLMQVEYQSQPVLSSRAEYVNQALVVSVITTALGRASSVPNVGLAVFDHTSRTCTRVVPVGHA